MLTLASISPTRFNAFSASKAETPSTPKQPDTPPTTPPTAVDSFEKVKELPPPVAAGVRAGKNTRVLLENLNWVNVNENARIAKLLGSFSTSEMKQLKRFQNNLKYREGAEVFCNLIDGCLNGIMNPIRQCLMRDVTVSGNHLDVSVVLFPPLPEPNIISIDGKVTANMSRLQYLTEKPIDGAPFSNIQFFIDSGDSIIQGTSRQDRIDLLHAIGVYDSLLATQKAKQAKVDAAIFKILSTLTEPKPHSHPILPIVTEHTPAMIDAYIASQA